MHATPIGARGASLESNGGRHAVLSHRTGWLAPRKTTPLFKETLPKAGRGGLAKAIPRDTWPYAAEPQDDVKGCSIAMPSIPSGNTNAPTIALAEKASDLIASAA